MLKLFINHSPPECEPVAEQKTKAEADD